jgi:cell division septum initiation protein DivIVA
MTQTPSFRTVLRGYDPGDVDQRFSELSRALVAARQEAADRTVELTQLQQANTRLKEGQADLERRLGELEDSQRRAAAPSFADLGERIGTILSLADEEADEIRRSAVEDARALRGSATTEVDESRRSAERYATEVRGSAEAEAARVVEKARQQADALLDDADREASARREEGEAFYESQRARAAAAAADFEATLGARRESAAEEFARQMAVHEQALAEAEQRAASLAAESESAHRQARTEATTLLDSARQEAEGLVAAAREKAERVRRESERELAAATARRDSITAQLSNVRQMLSTLGGAPMVEHLVGDTEGAAPTAAPPPEGEQQPDEADETGSKGDRKQRSGTAATR